jgi:hypothetical protein
MRNLVLASMTLGFLSCLTGCGRSEVPDTSAAAAQIPVCFREVTREAGIRFSLGHGGRHPLTILETAGCGGAFLDYDQDGWLDLFLAGQPTPGRDTACALYRNRGDGTFSDVTRAAGLDRPAVWMGCAVGDYDNDGYPDLLLAGHGALALFHNGPTSRSAPARRRGDGATGGRGGGGKRRPNSPRRRRVPSPPFRRTASWSCEARSAKWFRSRGPTRRCGFESLGCRRQQPRRCPFRRVARR